MIKRICFLMFLSSWILSARADTVILKNGRQVKNCMVIKEASDSIQVEVEGGVIMTLPTANLDKVLREDNFVRRPTPTYTSRPTRTFTPTVRPTFTPTPLPMGLDPERVRRAYQSKGQVRRGSIHEPVLMKSAPRPAPTAQTAPKPAPPIPGGASPAEVFKDFAANKDKDVKWLGKIQSIQVIQGATIITFEPDGVQGKTCTVHCDGTDYPDLKQGDTIRIKGRVGGTRPIGGQTENLLYSMERPSKVLK